eukprot:1156199-Pelagomonas_calceolata.AAC.8
MSKYNGFQNDSPFFSKVPKDRPCLKGVSLLGKPRPARVWEAPVLAVMNPANESKNARVTLSGSVVLGL